MENISAYSVLFSVCGLIILSYLFSVLNKATRIPSVLLLLGTGILLRYLSVSFNIPFDIPQSVTEILGTVGLIIIVLEAGLGSGGNTRKTASDPQIIFIGIGDFSGVVLGVAGILQWCCPKHRLSVAWYMPLR